MERAEFESFRRENRRASRRLWWAVLVGAVVAGVLIGDLWSYAVGIPVTILIALTQEAIQLRSSKARWLKRFPELRDQQTGWQRDRGPIP